MQSRDSASGLSGSKCADKPDRMSPGTSVRRCRAARRRANLTVELGSERHTASVSEDFVGGASTPGSWGRVNVTWPMAVLRVDEMAPFRVSLRFRGPARLFGAEDLTLDADGLDSVQLVRGLMSNGVGFSPKTGEDILFWTTRGPELLAVLRAKNYPVKDTVGKARAQWGWQGRAD